MDHIPHDEQQQHYHQQQQQYYSQEQDPGYMHQYAAAAHMQTAYHPVVTGQTRQLEIQQQQQQQQGLHPQQQTGHYPILHQYQYAASSPPHVPLPLVQSGAASPPPPSPEIYEAMSPNLSGSDTSGEGIYHHSNSSASSGVNSPSSSRGNSLVHRTPRYNPTPSPASSSGRRSRARSRSSDDDDDVNPEQFMANLAHSRKEATRRQRIEAEQRRRDELRDGYAKLKDVLPVSNQKSNKVNLLERATNHIVALEKNNQDLQSRIAALEREIQRLRSLNDKIALTNETSSPGMSMGDSRQLTPSLDPSHSSRVHQTSSAGSSPSAASEGY